MNLLQNVKIRTKLILGFASTIALSIILIIVAGANLHSISEDGYNIVSKNLKPLEHLNIMRGDYGNILVQLKNVYFAVTPEDRERFKGFVADNTDSFIENANACLAIAKDNKQQEMAEQIQSLIDSMNEHTELRKGAYDLADKGDSVAANLFSTTQIMPVGNKVNELLLAVYTENVTMITDTATANLASSERVTFLIIIIGLVGSILAIILAVFITKSITRPVRRLTIAAEELSKGDFNVNLVAKGRDEFATLTQCLHKVLETQTAFITEINDTVSKQFQGEFDVLLNEDKFQGGYKEVAKGFNSILIEDIKLIEDIIKILTDFSNGDFHSQISNLPGKKTIINENINGMRNMLIGVTEEINTLVKSAINGSLTKRADVTKFKGDWATIIDEINTLFEAIIMPINVVSDALNKMSHGDLHVKIHQQFNGDYAIIKNSLELSQKQIANYINEISTVLSEISSKNLNVNITHEYVGEFEPIKNSLELIITEFNTMLMSMGKTANNVTLGTAELERTSGDIAVGSSEQFKAIDRINSTIGDIAAKTKENAENSNTANQLTIAAKETAKRGNSEMDGMLQAMEGISESSNSISKIIKVIDDIAFQTNLLALNASVEAARAGEHGKGFAVVAEEVRNLAGRSKQAASETSVLIESSLEKVNRGSLTAEGTAKALREIESQIEEVSNIIFGISNSSSEQAQSIDFVNSEIIQISGASQLAMSTSQEQLSTVERIAAETTDLARRIDEFDFK